MINLAKQLFGFYTIWTPDPLAPGAEVYLGRTFLKRTALRTRAIVAEEVSPYEIYIKTPTGQRL